MIPGPCSRPSPLTRSSGAFQRRLTETPFSPGESPVMGRCSMRSSGPYQQKVMPLHQALTAISGPFHRNGPLYLSKVHSTGPFVLAMMLGYGGALLAQSPAASKYNLGRAPTEQELHAPDAHIPPDGEGLPPGSGTAKRGEVVYQTRGCGSCHGPTGTEGPGPRLVGPPGPPVRLRAPSSHIEHGGGNNFPGRGIVN